jgi:hypothetical protein
MQRPSALGLMLCDQVIIERDTNKPTLVGVFKGLGCSQFPSTPRPMEVFAILTDGQGLINLDIVVIRLETDERTAARRIVQEFPTPLDEVDVRFRLRTLSFPAPGTYLFELQADGEAICHRRLRVYHLEEPL